MHQTIKKVTEHIDNFHYNTALAVIMEYVNTLSAEKPTKEAIETLTLLIAPFAPHLSEEVWREIMGKEGSVHKAKWPTFNPELTVEELITIPVQVNGKLRDQIQIQSDQANDETFVVSQAQKSEKVVSWIGDKKIKKTIYIPGRLLNFVI